jgi:hypothetical protein
VGAPHELFARPPLSPLFHLYTLAPLYLRPTLGTLEKFGYWTLVVHEAPPGLTLSDQCLDSSPNELCVGVSATHEGIPGYLLSLVRSTWPIISTAIGVLLSGAVIS